MHCPETVENAHVGLGVGLGVGLLYVRCGVGDGVATPSHCLFEMSTIRIVRSHFAQMCMLFCSSVNTTSVGLFFSDEDEAPLVLKRDIIVVVFRYCHVLASLIR